ncbi:MAG: hemolysin family protein [Alkalibacterium sp.]|uniref:Hemolysin, contains CBS domains n=1 Tax=Alkalibacterium gilvum TaxID=1130080 RepID=A0A1H6QZZ8_9LACT|nr:hemolysin family protein [Alkalibacterium gilvum]MDN6728602.1 hemolysin family protein [Alkalibacterium sp.]SEI49221.1 Hemolysin, contains CBS domains [Alkalibacterium gilvum]
MDSDNIRSIIILAALVFLSAYFSSSETAFTSANRIRLRNEAEKGDKRSQKTLKLAENFDSVLSTILIGNNIVNIGMSAMATLLFVSWFPVYGPTIATVVMTIIILIFGEITPKSIAKAKSETFAKASTPYIYFLMTIFKPVLWILKKWKVMLDRIFHLDEIEIISEDELLSIVDEAESGGSIEDHESQLVKSAIEFDDLEVSTILTPRVDVVSTELDSTDQEIEELFMTHNYSRLIIYEESIDNVVGVLHEKDFNRYLRSKENKNYGNSLLSVVKDVIFVPPVMNLSRLLRYMQQSKTHMAIVADEHGGTIGIATMEDALEELVGEIWDESDIIDEEVIELKAGKRYKIKGTASLEKIFELFGLSEHEKYVSNSVSGFVIEELGQFPQVGDSFKYYNMKVSVTAVRNRRVLEVQIDYLPSDIKEG